jgi:hypothetical protein
LSARGERVGCLEWDPSPSLTAVEKVLRAHLDEPIIAIGYLDVRQDERGNSNSDLTILARLN